MTKNITNFEFLFSLFPKYGIAPQCEGFRTHNFLHFPTEPTKIATSTFSPPPTTTTLLKSKIKLSFLFFACQKPLFLLFPWLDMYYFVLLLFLDYLEMIRNNFYVGTHSQKYQWLIRVVQSVKSSIWLLINYWKQTTLTLHYHRKCVLCSQFKFLIDKLESKYLP